MYVGQIVQFVQHPNGPVEAAMVIHVYKESVDGVVLQVFGKDFMYRTGAGPMIDGLETGYKLITPDLSHFGALVEVPRDVAPPVLVQAENAARSYPTTAGGLIPGFGTFEQAVEANLRPVLEEIVGDEMAAYRNADGSIDTASAVAAEAASVAKDLGPGVKATASFHEELEPAKKARPKPKQS